MWKVRNRPSVIYALYFNLWKRLLMLIIFIAFIKNVQVPVTVYTLPLNFPDNHNIPQYRYYYFSLTLGKKTASKGLLELFKITQQWQNRNSYSSLFSVTYTLSFLFNLFYLTNIC